MVMGLSTKHGDLTLDVPTLRLLAFWVDIDFVCGNASRKHCELAVSIYGLGKAEVAIHETSTWFSLADDKFEIRGPQSSLVSYRAGDD
jgi:hypothetical protein